MLSTGSLPLRLYLSTDGKAADEVTVVGESQGNLRKKVQSEAIVNRTNPAVNIGDHVGKIFHLGGLEAW